MKNKKFKTLDELCDYLNDFLVRLSDPKSGTVTEGFIAEYMNLFNNHTSFPVFEKNPPHDTEDIYSWDDERFMIIDEESQYFVRDEHLNTVEFFGWKIVDRCNS